jgi:glycosyltransferase involved in cell wall biosynthesis
VKIFIYNPNSRGGNYEYAIRLSEAYALNPMVKGVSLLLPRNANLRSVRANKFLLSDIPWSSNRLISQCYFLFRSLANPLRLFLFLLRETKGKVIFNDYDQATSFLWTPFFRLIKNRFVFSVILHDPDRDAYFRNKRLSETTMKRVMSIMDIAFFHDLLPSKSYYSDTDIKYVDVPHGIFRWDVDGHPEDFQKSIETFKGDSMLVAALGNIRTEKNYKMIIQAIGSVKNLKLVIAGLPANSSVQMNDYRQLVINLRLTDRVLIIEKYLSASEMNALAQLSKAFILYYSHTFKSQSGLLNFFAPFRKPLLVSDNESPLSALVKKFKLGLLAKPDCQTELLRVLRKLEDNDINDQDWDGYMNYASWDRHVDKALQAFNEIDNVKA